MVKARTLVIAALIAAAATAAVFILAPDEEKKIRKQFTALSESVSKDPDESPLGMAQKLLKIGALFGEKCDIETRLQSLSGRFTPEEISGYAGRVRAFFSDLRLRFSDLSVEFPESETARVTLTGRITGRLTNGERVDETHELESTLKKTAKGWLFTSIGMVEVLKK
jgi:hypothetical protein